jgi:nitrate/nitrite-specific signal transduction histidine kinase
VYSRVAVQSLHTFAGLLGEVDTPTPTSAFWDRLCAATCRLAGVDRALVFVYDDARQDVRAVGSHGMTTELFGSVHVGMAPVAEQALETDSVVVVQAHRGDPGLPREYVELLELRTVLCTPMSAGGFWYGVLMADRGAEEFEPDESQLEMLWTVGKTAALAVAARTATRQSERARALTDRIDLARDVHDGVIQRLFGVSLALSTDGDMPAAVRERCRSEVQAALDELREAIQRPLGRTTPAVRTTLRELLDELGAQREVVLDEGADVTVPPDLEPLAQSVVAEAVRNARKHAAPTRIRVRLRRSEQALHVEVLNDGVVPRDRGNGGGMGLRLAGFEALQHGGVLEFGARGADEWQVRLTVPVDGGT